MFSKFSKRFILGLVTVFLWSLSLTWATAKPLNKIRMPDHYTFKPGDDLNWKDPGLEDQDWAEYALNRFPYDRWTGIGWFRYHIQVDSGLSGKTFGMSVKQVGAMEIYLDGRLIAQLGKVGQTPDEEKIYFREGGIGPFSLEFLQQSGAATHLLAIRYSNFISTSPISMELKPLFRFRFGQLQEMEAEREDIEEKATLHRMFLLGLFMAFMTVHFLLYLFYPRIRENLYFAIVLAASAMLTFFRFGQFFTRNAEEAVLNLNMQGVSASLLILSAILLAYIFIQKRMRIRMLAFAAVALALNIWQVFQPFVAYPYMYFFYLIGMLEILRVIMAIGLGREKMKGDGGRIILAGMLILVVSSVYQILVISGIIAPLWRGIDFPVVYYALVTLTVCMSVYLSRTFALTNRELEHRLAEVKRLSEENLQQEIARVALESENARKSRELEEARNLQLSMLPKKLPDLDQADMAVCIQTATEVGGDYYDFRFEGNDALTIAFGDATGHGLQSGTVVTATKSLFKSLGTEKQPAVILKKISDALKQMGFSRMFMAMLVAKVRGYEINFAVAGMPDPLIFEKKTKTIFEINLHGIPLGTFAGYDYPEKIRTFSPGDVILFMSDGLPELFNPQHEQLGDERIKKYFLEVCHKGPQEIIDHLERCIREWAGGKPPDDDITLLVLKFK